jgi:glycosyltransferase involved in cell wall biosynthesis
MMKLGLSRLLGPLAPRRAQDRRIALAAIVRNEAEYLVEWIAWHRNAGFTDFFLSDNGSDDGTLELLQRLAAAGVVRLRQEPRGAAAQLKAYNAMLAAWGRDVDRIAYLDADEFLVASDERRPVDHLEDLLAASDVGAVAVNWRMFGSSGHQQREPGLVIERFTRCAPDDYPGCIHVKTYARPAAIAQQRIHRANLKPRFRTRRARPPTSWR